MLQVNLMMEDLLEHILSLLQDSQVKQGVRYFAGGTLAQLVSRPEAWTLDDELRSTILKQLVCVRGKTFWMLVCIEHKFSLGSFQSVFLSLQHASIMTWTQIEKEMVSYR